MNRIQTPLFGNGFYEYRELTEEEENKFHLTYQSGANDAMRRVHKPVWEGNIEVWATAFTPTSPWYRLYNCGTNHLKVLRYTPSNDTWEEIPVEQIHNLYGLLWILIGIIGNKK